MRLESGSSEESVAALGEPNARVRDATFSADESRAIVIAEPNANATQKIILVYDAATGKLTDRTLREVGTGDQCVRMSTDERHLMTLDTSALRIADVVTGMLIREWKFPTNRLYRIVGLAFNPAGDRIATLDTDGTFSMIDVAVGRFVDQANWTMLAGTKTVPMVFDPSGNRVMFLYDKEVHAWSFIPSVQDMLDNARAYVPSCIAPASRSDFYLADEPPAWCIERGKVWDFLSHPSAIGVADPNFEIIDLIIDSVKRAGSRAKLVSLDNRGYKGAQIGHSCTLHKLMQSITLGLADTHL